MKRILVVSDSHGRGGNIKAVIKQVGKVDMLIHCGDVEHEEEYIRGLIDGPVHMVAGNCDYFCDLPEDDIFEVEGYRIMVTHGHRYFVHGSTMFLKEYALEHGIDIVMYGHIHRPYIEIGEDVTILNPGSIAYPRQEDRKRTFLLMEIDDFGDAHYAHGIFQG